MDHPEKYIILDDYEEKNDDVIDEEEVYCKGVRRSRRGSRPVEIPEPRWDKYKSHL